MRKLKLVADNAEQPRLDPFCQVCAVRDVAICRAVRGPLLQEFCDVVRHRHFTANTEIVHQDDSSKLFAIIVSGVVKLSRIKPDGRQQIVGLLSAADCLGNMFSSRSNWNITCVSDVKLCCFQREQFKVFMDANPVLERTLLQKASEDLEDARKWLAMLGGMSAVEQIASLLLWLRKKDESHDPRSVWRDGVPIVNIPLSREEIAEILGLSRETVSRVLSHLETLGLIEFMNFRSLKLTDLAELRRISGSDDTVR